jgi:hypothetical protein
MGIVIFDQALSVAKIDKRSRLKGVSEAENTFKNLSKSHKRKLKD